MLGDCIAWLGSAVFGILSYWWLVRRYPVNFRIRNFQGVFIPSSGGLAIVLACEPAYTWLLRERLAQSAAIVECAMLCVIGFGLLGLIDDIFGDRTIGGLKGHFGALVRKRQLTTGSVKAVGGLTCALIAGFILNPHQALLPLEAAAIISLAANAVNLTDTRPGRGLFITLAFWIAGCMIGMTSFNLTRYLVFVPPISIAAVFFLYDRKARLMLGDIGSNALGALVGLLWVCVAPWEGQLALLLTLLWFHWWTEKRSLNKSIESTPILKLIDGRIGVRAEA